jgi:hypothetical protein
MPMLRTYPSRPPTPSKLWIRRRSVVAGFSVTNTVHLEVSYRNNTGNKSRQEQTGADSDKICVPRYRLPMDERNHHRSGLWNPRPKTTAEKHLEVEHGHDFECQGDLHKPVRPHESTSGGKGWMEHSGLVVDSGSELLRPVAVDQAPSVIESKKAWEKQEWRWMLWVKTGMHGCAD